jgi:Lon-like ATP-dependent protease
MDNLNFKTTKEIKIPEKLIDQIIGQDHAVDIVKKASLQRRNVLLIGDPGTGKSLLAQSLAELLPSEKLVDVLSFANQMDENNPIIKTLPKGKGRELITKAKMQGAGAFKNQNIIFFIFLLLALISPWWIRAAYGDIMGAAALIGSMIFLAAFVIFMNISRKIKIGDSGLALPKLLIDNADKKKAPFLDATGAHAGALLGDVLHDPLQTGGLGTPAHERLVPGMIHKSNKGVLYIDEVANLKIESQQELLSAMQEKRYPITGQSERSSGAMTRSEPVPCDFVLVASGNTETIAHMHPALRSRIRGYGYEVYMQNTIDDTKENQIRFAQFVAQEIKKDGKIPHFTKEAVLVIIQEARRRAGTSGKLTLRLRELGGLIRAAGDVAINDKDKYVTPAHIEKAKALARSLEQQIADKYLEDKKKYSIFVTEGKLVGRVNGLAVIGGNIGSSGIVLPIEAEVTPGGKKAEFIATGKLGVIAKEAIKNVSAIILKSFKEDIKEKYDIFVQFIQTYEGVEGDSASIAVATAIVSALKNVPVKQNVAMTGSLSVRGNVLAVGGVSSKVEAAIEAGIDTIIVPKANENDILLSKDKMAKVRIIPVSNIKEVLKEAIDWKGKEKELAKIMA